MGTEKSGMALEERQMTARTASCSRRRPGSHARQQTRGSFGDGVNHRIAADGLGEDVRIIKLVVALLRDGLLRDYFEHLLRLSRAESSELRGCRC